MMPLSLIVDRREIALSNALEDFPHERKDLAAGDVLCEDAGRAVLWIAERKTASDLANSIKTAVGDTINR